MDGGHSPPQELEVPCSIYKRENHFQSGLEKGMLEGMARFAGQYLGLWPAPILDNFRQFLWTVVILLMFSSNLKQNEMTNKKPPFLRPLQGTNIIFFLNIFSTY